MKEISILLRKTKDNSTILDTHGHVIGVFVREAF